MFFSQKKCVEFLQKQFAKIYFPTFKVVVGGAEWQRARETQPKNFNQRISTKDYPSKITHQRIPIPKNINQRRQWEEGASGKELGRPNQRISITDTGLQANTDQVEQADISAYWKIEGFLYWQKIAAENERQRCFSKLSVHHRCVAKETQCQ